MSHMSGLGDSQINAHPRHRNHSHIRMQSSTDAYYYQAPSVVSAASQSTQSLVANNNNNIIDGEFYKSGAIPDNIYQSEGQRSMPYYQQLPPQVPRAFQYFDGYDDGNGIPSIPAPAYGDDDGYYGHQNTERRAQHHPVSDPAWYYQQQQRGDDRPAAPDHMLNMMYANNRYPSFY